MTLPCGDTPGSCSASIPMACESCGNKKETTMDMTIDEFCDKHNACASGRAWAHERCKSGMMSEAYRKLSKSKSDEAKNYFGWTWCRAFDNRTWRLIAIRMVRETPLPDGRHVVDLLTDPRSLAALDVAERYANGAATMDELSAARAAAWAAASSAASSAAWAAAWAAARAAALDAAWDAARAAAWAAAWDAAWDAQHKLILSYGNPFEARA